MLILEVLPCIPRESVFNSMLMLLLHDHFRKKPQILIDEGSPWKWLLSVQDKSGFVLVLVLVLVGIPI